MADRLFLLLAGLVLAAADLACASSSPRLMQQHSTCVVLRVIDGDTFHCRDGRKVRLTGIDSPERRQHPFGNRAQRALLDLLPPGSTVTLEYDLSPNDRYGRVLAYAWAESKLINEAMVQGGWAVLYTVPPNVKYAGRLERAQKEARSSGAGLWAEDGFACLPSEFRRRTCLSSP